MHYFTFILFSFVLTWFMLTAQSRRRVVAVTVAGVLVWTFLIVPPAVEAQGGLIPAIQAVLKVLNTLILPVVKSINSTRSRITVPPSCLRERERKKDRSLAPNKD